MDYVKNPVEPPSRLARVSARMHIIYCGVPYYRDDGYDGYGNGRGGQRGELW